MSAWTNGTYTEKGLALLSKLTQGSTLKITRAVAGTGYVSTELLAKQTAVSGIKQELLFKAASYPEAGLCKLPMFLTNAGLTAGYTAKQIGLYANDPDAGEILYFISQSSTGTVVPSAAEMPEYSATWTFYFRYGQADTVSVTVDPSHTVTEDMLNEVRDIAEQGVSVAKRGAVARFDNAAAVPLAGLKLFGKTTQDGTPTPDAPVEMVSAENTVVSVCGKNLAVVKSGYSVDVNGITIDVDPNTSEAKINGTAKASFSHAVMRSETLQPGTYTASVIGVNVVGPASNLLDRLYVANANTGDILVNYIKDGYPKTFTLNEEAVVRVDMVFAAGTTYNNKAIKIQIERGAVATEYEPYKAAQTLSTVLNLRGIPVASGGNYTDENGQQWVCDELDFARGVYAQRVNLLTISPTNPKTFIGSDNFIYYPMADYGVYGTKVLCSHYGSEEVGFNSTGASAKFPGFATVDEFNAFVANNSVDVAYILATPVETALSAEELAAFAALRANNPCTTISNSAGAGMEVHFVQAQHEASFKLATAGQLTEDPAHPGCFFRAVDGEVEWQNPPMADDVEYRTTERYNRKPVYVTKVTFDDFPTAANASINKTTVIPLDAKIVGVAGTLANGDSSAYSLPAFDASGLFAFADVNKLRAELLPDDYTTYEVSLYSGRDYESDPSYTTTVVVKYTKS